jgi:protein ImuB
MARHAKGFRWPAAQAALAAPPPPEATPAPAHRRWIALHLPALALESWVATLDSEVRHLPLALLDGTRVAAVDAAAAALGVRPGQQRATALALAPALRFGQADAARDARALGAVAHAALQFTPAVALHGGDTVLLEVASTLRLFGGLSQLAQRLDAALEPLGHQVVPACAPTALGAALLARWASPDPPRALFGPHATRLAALRALLDTAPATLLWSQGGSALEMLQGLGLRTLGELRVLPRDGLARRFGPAMLDLLDRARGDAPDPQDWVRPPERFAEQLELHARADTAAQLQHAAGLSLARLVAWARAQQGRVQRCTLGLRHEPRHRADDAVPELTTLEIALAEPSADATHLQGLLRERLARLVLPAPVTSLDLRCEELVFATPPDGELFPTRAAGQAGLARLLERLQARLGEDRVQRLEPVDDHRPERAAQTRASALPVAAAVVAVARRPAPVAGSSPHPPARLTRPAWLLPEPQPLTERGPHPCFGGQPLQLLAGPERIECGWWDDALAARDYFVAQTHDGALAWIFRSRLPGAATPAGWFLQGWFG